MKMKMKNKEQKTVFAARVVNSQDDWLSAEELYELIDKRSVRTTVEKFSANLSDAFKKGMVHKRRGLDKNGKGRILYATTRFDVNGALSDVLIVQTEQKVKRTNQHQLPAVLDVPLGMLLEYVTDVSKDDLMSVLRDLIYSTPTRELRERYPALEDTLFDIVGGDE
tara:strand:- start:7308 stop:7805 length:498 start_codon:yes stop_codon:yes gene_type:complete